MANGILFEGKDLIASLYTDIIIFEAHDSEVSQGQMITSCTGGQEGSAVGLWQWALQPSGSSDMLLSTTFFCRYGANANVPPACPFNACMNGDCSVCADDWKA